MPLKNKDREKTPNIFRSQRRYLKIIFFSYFLFLDLKSYLEVSNALRQLSQYSTA